MRASSADSLDVRILLPDQVSPGEAVPISLRAENTSNATVDLYLRGRAIAFDVVVTGVAGRVVWRRLEDEVIPAVLRIETLEPGGRLELEATWDQRSLSGEAVPAGVYHVHGEILTDGDPLVTAVVPLRVLD